ACERQAAPKGIMLVRVEGEDIHARVNRNLIEQAVFNLVDNAVKYSGTESTVEVSATRRGDELVIAVKDHGCGIEKAHLSRVFERFYRVDRSRSRKEGGTGLGLAIVKLIAQAHGGRALVESIMGEGSTFSLQIPLSL